MMIIIVWNMVSFSQGGNDDDHDNDGTWSGLPKAAIITHSRYLFASYCLFCMGLAVEQDVLYSGFDIFVIAYYSWLPK